LAQGDQVECESREPGTRVNLGCNELAVWLMKTAALEVAAQ
jgi:hypothetical protein